ncbi:response regulator [Paenibacillus sp. XY044]|uniref:response regulator n=1 Tax=Paenibacillus sp. XY044 TaxID=2026089 RepID=UPI000B988C10|nr:response regulator [Paenibacillus sp. XY044]OZB92184.1 two-component system response regulator [Paenibacillus sp. XY044]
MNLLIAEDEDRLRSSLAYNIPWEEHGIEVVGLAENGLRALELFEHQKPDIVLMDIQMPEMDGISLIREIQHKDAMVKLIILSGHDNFEYAQIALEHGVVKYLLKPAGEDEIVNAVLEAADQLRVELERLNHQIKLEERWQQHLPYLRERFMQHWMSGKYDPQQVLEISHDLGIELGNDWQYTLVVLDLDDPAPTEAAPGDRDRRKLMFSLNRLATELLYPVPAWIVMDTNERTVILFHALAGEDKNRELLTVNTIVDRLLSRLKEVLKVPVNGGISGSTGGREDVSKLYLQAVKALQSRMLYGAGIAIPYREEQGAACPELEVHPHLEKKLEIALETGDERKARAIVDEMWDTNLGQAESLEEAREYVLYWSGLLIRMMQKMGWSVKEVTGDDYALFQNLRLLSTKEQVRGWIFRTVEGIVAQVERQRKAVSHQTVKRILNMVEAEIDREITLHTVASRMYVNSSYLSRLFKQETGKAFSAYVVERRMELAKATLQKGARVYDAARTVGYRDVSYFTKVFRKYWGVTPSEIK